MVCDRTKYLKLRRAFAVKSQTELVSKTKRKNPALAEFYDGST